MPRRCDVLGQCRRGVLAVQRAERQRDGDEAVPGAARANCARPHGGQEGIPAELPARDLGRLSLLGHRPRTITTSRGAMDSASPSEGEGCGFKSRRDGQPEGQPAGRSASVGSGLDAQALWIETTAFRHGESIRAAPDPRSKRVSGVKPWRSTRRLSANFSRLLAGRSGRIRLPPLQPVSGRLGTGEPNAL